MLVKISPVLRVYTNGRVDRIKCTIENRLKVWVIINVINQLCLWAILVIRYLDIVHYLRNSFVHLKAAPGTKFRSGTAAVTWSSDTWVAERNRSFRGIVFHSQGLLTDWIRGYNNAPKREKKFGFRNQYTGCIKKGNTENSKIHIFLSPIDFRSLGIQNGSNRTVDLLIVISVSFVCTPDFIQTIVPRDTTTCLNSGDQTSFVLLNKVDIHEY